MEKKQYDLCLEILRRFNKAGVLKDFILIGSWCIVFYKDYFAKQPYIDQGAIKTRDIDFLIETPSKIREEVNIPDLLRDLGFVTIFKGRQGYLKLDHPDLILEFLAPERGRGIDKPLPLPKLGINAVTLRFLSFLTSHTIKVKVEDFYVALPHPANFALHKLIIFQRRFKKDKAAKDRIMAIDILKALIDKGESRIIKKVFNSVPTKWRKKIIQGLEQAQEREILEVLT
ncbi:MAG: GSU2403 family nucleotidyltransferase fold protein [Candidatus Omnitrophota bacterium]